jgi:hypothetical protein
MRTTDSTATPHAAATPAAAHGDSLARLEQAAPPGVNTLQWKLSNMAERQSILDGMDGPQVGRSAGDASAAGATLAEMAASKAASRGFGPDPLKTLNRILARNASSANLDELLSKLQDTPARNLVPGPPVRTPTRTDTGASAILVGQLFKVIAKNYDEATEAQKKALDVVLRDHFRLLDTPMNRGGLKVDGVANPAKGIPAAGRGISGATEGKGVDKDKGVVAVNQTATVLLGLYRLNAVEGLRKDHPEIKAHLDKLAPEFRAELVKSYKGDPRVTDWRYGPNARPEDPAHLYTTYQQLGELADAAHHAGDKKGGDWYKAQAARINEPNNCRSVIRAELNGEHLPNGSSKPGEGIYLGDFLRSRPR